MYEREKLKNEVNQSEEFNVKEMLQRFSFDKPLSGLKKDSVFLDHIWMFTEI